VIASAVTNAQDAGVVVYRDRGGIDAIDEYSRRLVNALGEIGAPARYRPDGVHALARTDRRTPWVLLQYNPQSFGRWGFAPMLICSAMALRSRTGARFVLSVHEPWVDSYDWRSTLMSGYQHIQLRPLLATADAIITMTESLARTLGRGAVPIPVGSNITPVMTDAVAARERLHLEDRFVVSLFGRAHPSRALDYAERAISELAAASVGRRLTVLNLGDLAPGLTVPGHVDIRTVGGLDPVELSHALSASHMLLLPFTDGISARRTTLMAGLAHGVPVVGLDGRDTDRVLIAPDALVLTPVGDRAAFARAVVALAGDDARLREVGEAGRRLYAARFGWPVVARKVLDVITASR
jgi:glycosyltransferase involved in cell wall biosynthesis